MKKIVFTLDNQLKKVGMGQRELSRQSKEIDPEGAGVRQALISDICRNKIEHIPVKKLNLICTVLDCDLSEVMRLERH